mgnify:CR=1 FL=1
MANNILYFNGINIGKSIKDVSCEKIVKELYQKVSNKVYICSDIKTAEFTKLLENIYRSVNIGLINELHNVCKKMRRLVRCLQCCSHKPHQARRHSLNH